MKDRMMKEMMLPAVALAALCSSACDRNDRADRTDQSDVAQRAEPAPAAGAKDHEVAPHDGHEPAASADAPSRADSSQVQALDPSSGVATKVEQTRAEYVAASRRRLEDMERELQQLETRSRERGKQLRGEIREEKRRLDRELDQLDKESDQAWTQMKGGFADALERLETQIREVRKDIDPAT